MAIDPRVRTLVRDNRGTRVHILIVLWAMSGPATAKDIAAEINCHRNTVEDMLPLMEQDGYVARFGAGRHPRWGLTDRARQLPLPNLENLPAANRIQINDVENFLPVPSSSSSISDPPDLDQIRSEEEESTPQERSALVTEYRLTGEYRATVLADPWITRRRFEGWYEYAECEKKRFPAAYAVHCCTNHHEPPEPQRDGDIGAAWQRATSGKYRADRERYERTIALREEADT